MQAGRISAEIQRRPASSWRDPALGWCGTRAELSSGSRRQAPIWLLEWQHPSRVHGSVLAGLQSCDPLSVATIASLQGLTGSTRAGSPLRCAEGRRAFASCAEQEERALTRCFYPNAGLFCPCQIISASPPKDRYSQEVARISRGAVRRQTSPVDP